MPNTPYGKSTLPRHCFLLCSFMAHKHNMSLGGYLAASKKVFSSSMCFYPHQTLEARCLVVCRHIARRHHISVEEYIEHHAEAIACELISQQKQERKARRHLISERLCSFSLSAFLYCGLACLVFLIVHQIFFAAPSAPPRADDVPAARMPDSLSQSVVDKDTPAKKQNSGKHSSGGNGAALGNRAADGYAYVPTKGGTKYHSLDTCSAMDSPLYVTLADAIAYGYGPCGKCW